MSKDPVIIAEGLTCDFNGIRALDSLSIQIPRGIVFGLLGHNGSGKTTFIRLSLGLLKPSSGKVAVFAFDSQQDGATIRGRTGVLSENTGLYEDFSILDNLDIFGRFYHLSKEDRISRIKETLQLLNLWERREQLPKALSRGLRQRVSIAGALLHRPELLILDEPTLGLDPQSTDGFWNELKQRIAEGTSVLVATNNLSEAEEYCDLIGVIHQGKLMATGTPTDLREKAGPAQYKLVLPSLKTAYYELIGV